MFPDHFVNAVMRLRPHPPKSLYHYCRAESLKYLLQTDSDIWCTHCSHLNDPEECWTGIRMYLDYIEKNSLLTPQTFAILAECARSNSVWNKLLAKDEHSKIMPFTFSFSESEDDDRMWNYAQKCGYRLEFDGDLIEQNAGRVQSVLSKIDMGNRMSLSLWPCFYENSNRDEIMTLFDALSTDTSEWFTAIENNPNDIFTINHLVTSMATMSPIIKAEKWSYEHEWRLIMVRENFDRIVWKDHRARSYMSSSPMGIRGLITHIQACPHGDVEWEMRYLDYEINDGYRSHESEREFL